MSDDLTRREFLQITASGVALAGLASPTVRAQLNTIHETAALQGLPAFDGTLNDQRASLELMATDRGGMMRHLPRAVLYPGSIEDVARMVRYAQAKRIPVVMRGRGHSAYGQTLSEGGIVIDSSTLNQVIRVSGDTIEIEAGASLGALSRAAFEAGLRVPVMSGCSMLSVGGWISVGGVAGESLRQGAFIDQVIELQLVTGRGNLITCSDQHEPELFAMALAGMGQCGIIVAATFRLVSAHGQATFRTIDYASLESFLADQQRFAANDRLDSLWATISRRADGNWRYPVMIGRYGALDEDADPSSVIGDIARGRSAVAVRLPYRDIVPPPSAAAATRQPVNAPAGSAHASKLVSQPALCVFLPASVAGEILMPLLSSPSDSAGISIIECVALNTDRFRRPLFRLPREERIFSCWILRTANPDSGPSLQSQLAVNARFLKRALAMGAVRYPPFGGNTTPADWRIHYGEALYQRFANAKQKYDERGILTPGAGIFT